MSGGISKKCLENDGWFLAKMLSLATLLMAWFNKKETGVPHITAHPLEYEEKERKDCIYRIYFLLE